MLIVVRSEENVSPKTNFIIDLASQRSIDVFYVFRKESDKFSERWSHNQVLLRSSNKAVIMNYLLMLMKSPKDLRNGFMYRVFSAKRKRVLTGYGFLSMLSRALYLRTATSAKSDNLFDLIKRLKVPKIFLIDEFISLNCLDIKKLKALGSIIYVSQDIAYNRFGFGDNRITRNLMFRLEKAAVANFDLVIACSEMECLKYLELGADKAIFYPNIYPTKGSKNELKNNMPSISIVLRSHWGQKAEKSLELIFNALSLVKVPIKVYMIGIKPKKIPKNVILIYRDFISTKLEYLQLISRSWIGINLGIHKAGTNERKYDYAEAGLVVISDSIGARGDLLPHEYTYIDTFDLSAKINQLLEFGKVQLTNMGEENRQRVSTLADQGRLKLLDIIDQINVKDVTLQ